MGVNLRIVSVEEQLQTLEFGTSPPVKLFEDHPAFVSCAAGPGLTIPLPSGVAGGAPAPDLPTIAEGRLHHLPVAATVDVHGRHDDEPCLE